MREIRYDVVDGIATLTIDRPEKRGAMTYAMLDEFSASVAATRVALAECFASADHAEGVAAFLEKRPARFTGR
jgi:enoyl-CoA hydratase/carnithine racemase